MLIPFSHFLLSMTSRKHLISPWLWSRLTNSFLCTNALCSTFTEAFHATGRPRSISSEEKTNSWTACEEYRSEKWINTSVRGTKRYSDCFKISNTCLDACKLAYYVDFLAHVPNWRQKNLTSAGLTKLGFISIPVVVRRHWAIPGIFCTPIQTLLLII